MVVWRKTRHACTFHAFEPHAVAYIAMGQDEHVYMAVTYIVLD